MRKPGKSISLLIGALAVEQTSGQRWNVISATPGSIPSSETVELSCVFDNDWSAATHPIDYPGTDAHWSPMVLASHSSSFTMWASGGTASPGVISVAEVS